MKNSFFSPEFLLSLPSDHLEALVALFREFQKFADHCRKNDRYFPSFAAHEELIETLAIVRAYAEHGHLPLDLPTIGSDKKENAATINNFWIVSGEEWVAELTKRNGAKLYTDKSQEYASIFAMVPAYEFTDHDFARVQVLINELRQLISESRLVSDDHKRRLLRRLEAMQAELHKKTSDIDRFWGFIAEVSITTRKFGEDLKPISERASELGKIVIAVVLAKEGLKALPAISSLLDLAK